MQIACTMTDKNLQHNKQAIKLCQLGMFDFTWKLYNVRKQINKSFLFIKLDSNETEKDSCEA